MLEKKKCIHFLLVSVLVRKKPDTLIYMSNYLALVLQNLHTAIVTETQTLINPTHCVGREDTRICIYMTNAISSTKRVKIGNILSRVCVCVYIYIKKFLRRHEKLPISVNHIFLPRKIFRFVNNTLKLNDRFVVTLRVRIIRVTDVEY